MRSADKYLRDSLPLLVANTFRSPQHYMRGGRPGDFPDFDNKYIPGGALNLYDPFGWTRSLPKESKEKRLLAEVRNASLPPLPT